MLFVPVPASPDTRQQWYRSAHRDGAIASGALWACLDHFDVPDDLENYFYVKMIGGPLKVKGGVTPHKFTCQSRGVVSEQVLERRRALQQKRSLKEMLDDNVEVCNVEVCRSGPEHVAPLRRWAAPLRRWTDLLRRWTDLLRRWTDLLWRRAAPLRRWVDPLWRWTDLP